MASQLYFPKANERSIGDLLKIYKDASLLIKIVDDSNLFSELQEIQKKSRKILSFLVKPENIDEWNRYNLSYILVEEQISSTSDSILLPFHDAVFLYQIKMSDVIRKLGIEDTYYTTIKNYLN